MPNGKCRMKAYLPLDLKIEGRTTFEHFVIIRHGVILRDGETQDFVGLTQLHRYVSQSFSVTQGVRREA